MQAGLQTAAPACGFLTRIFRDSRHITACWAAPVGARNGSRQQRRLDRI